MPITGPSVPVRGHLVHPMMAVSDCTIEQICYIFHHMGRKYTIRDLTAFQQPALSDWFNKAFKTSSLDTKYSITPFINNSPLEADFNGDGLVDAAVLVSEKKQEKKEF